MPPTSRRQKAYEQNLHKVQRRNFAAGFILLLVAVGSFFLIRQLFVVAKPTIHVSINRINHSGTRQIPLSEESCNRVKEAFDTCLDSKTSDMHDVDEQQSELKITPSDIKPKDVLVVYLNGHLTDAKSRPSVLAIPKPGGEDNLDDEVYWIGPESGAVEKKLSELLENVNNSDAKIKILLLDAGRYSWSPTFPGRETNEFQSRLAAKMESNDWNLKDDFWIITSHSDAEISNVSTPLNGSLFAVAIAESLKSLSLKPNDNTKLQVPLLFDEIRKRTSTFSRNFEDKSLQNPVLMKAGVGIINRDAAETEPVVLTWKGPSEPQTDEPEPLEFQWRVFAENATDFSQWSFQSPNYAALPRESLQRIEMFLEQGEEETNWSSTEQGTLNDYERGLQSAKKKPLIPTDFAVTTFDQKQQRIDAFRRALLEFSVLTRFRNQMRFWDDNAFDVKTPTLPPGLASPFQLADDQLTKPKRIPLIESWPSQLKTFMYENEKLFEEVRGKRKRSKDNPLTPMQAELLGVLSARYLPLIDQIKANQAQASAPADETEPKTTDPLSESFALTMKPESRTDPYDPQRIDNPSDPSCGIKAVVSLGREELRGLVDSLDESATDTSYRYFLAVRGSEFATNRNEPFVVPRIAWMPIKKQITINAKSSESVFKVPFFGRKEVPFDLNTAVVDSVDLSIAEAGSKKLAGLKFGFDEEFVKELNITDLGDDARPFPGFKVHFHYPFLVPAMVGQRFDFEITATDRKEPSQKPYSFPFTIEITKDAEFKIESKRILANRDDIRSNVRLYRWGRPPTQAEREPLMLRTLANVRSFFDFKLTTNSESSHNFTVRLYNIKRFPAEINQERLTSDRDDLDEIRGFVRELAKQSNTAGIPPLERSESFELIAEAKVNLAKMSSEPIRFLPPPPKTESEATETPANSAPIKNGVIVAVYSDAEPTKNPVWYQLMFFQPQEPANATGLKQSRLKIKPDIVDKFGDVDILKLPESLVQTVDKKQAAKLTIVSENAFAENRNIAEVLDLDEILAGDGAELKCGNSHAFLLLEALGIPNYMTYQTDGATLTSTGFRRLLTGIRISEPPDNWKCYPNSWSFASDQPPGPPFDWLAGSSNEIQKFYVSIGKPDAAVGGRADDQGSGRLELYLPFKDNDVLLRRRDDFWVRWKGSNQKFQYPNQRRHFIEISENGLTSWSEVQSHSISISGISNQLIQIGRNGSDEPLGQWRFVTESPKTRPKLTASQTEFEMTEDQVGSTMITLDVSEIRPAVPRSSIQLSMDGQALEKNKLEKLLEQNTEKRGRYKFSFFELLAAFDKGISEPKDQDTLIEVDVTDFFGETCSRELRLKMTKPVPEKPKPKPTTLDISFSKIGDQPVKLYEFTGVQLNESSIPLNRATAFNGGTVRIESVAETPSVRIDGLFPGNYSIQITALIRREATAAQYLPASASAAQITVPEGGGKVELTFR